MKVGNHHQTLGRRQSPAFHGLGEKKEKIHGRAELSEFPHWHLTAVGHETWTRIQVGRGCLMGDYTEIAEGDQVERALGRIMRRAGLGMDDRPAWVMNALRPADSTEYGGPIETSNSYPVG